MMRESASERQRRIHREACQRMVRAALATPPLRIVPKDEFVEPYGTNPELWPGNKEALEKWKRRGE